MWHALVRVAGLGARFAYRKLNFYTGISITNVQIYDINEFYNA